MMSEKAQINLLRTAAARDASRAGAHKISHRANDGHQQTNHKQNKRAQAHSCTICAETIER